MIETQTNALSNETPASVTVELPRNTGDPESLRFYTKTKLALAAQLRALREMLKQRGSEMRLNQCDELMGKLAEDCFTLAVLGQFKRGKSSLMNAIVGRELLPVGVLPLTSAITILRYGPKERLLIRREDMDLPFPQEFPVGQLAEFVTEKKNPGNSKRLKTACVELPAPFLRRGLEFVDTPGIGSAIEANTITTLKFLPECDAALFVTSVDSPFTSGELEFLENIRRHVRKIFFVVNKTDLLGADERREVLDFVGDTIRKQMDTDDVKVFSVSSRLGLAAKLSGDWLDGLESGLSELENALARFLSGEKASVFLAAIIRRALRLLEEESVEAGLHAQAVELPEKAFLERLGAVTARWENRKTERRQIFERLQRRILSEVHMALMPELLSFINAETIVFADAVERLLMPLRWWPLWDIWEKIEQTALNQTYKNISGWLSERADQFSFVSDETVRADWQRIQSNLAGLPVIAADIFGLRRSAKADGEALPPWHLNVKFETPFAFNFRCRVQLPAWPTMLPVCLTRKWLKEHLRKEGGSMTKGWRDAVIVYAADNVRKALEHLADEVEVRADEVGLRMMASLRSDKPFTGDPEAEAATLDVIRRQLLALRAEICPDALSAINAPDESGEISDRVAVASQPSAVSTNGGAVEPVIADLAADLKTRSCPACDHLSKAAFHFLTHFQYNLTQNETTQKAFALGLGFCSLHTWQLEAVSSPVGASIGFAKLAEHISRILAEKAGASNNGRSARELFFKPNECRVCQLLREAEQDYLRRMGEFIGQPNGRAAYTDSQGVCLRHLNLWLPFLNGNETIRFVLKEASRRFEQMSEDMQHFSMKTDALRRDLRNTDECDAYLRTVIHLAGTKGNCWPMSKETKI
jgi:GTP-binding protein EngB required for normal cell division